MDYKLNLVEFAKKFLDGKELSPIQLKLLETLEENPDTKWVAAYPPRSAGRMYIHKLLIEYKEYKEKI